LSEKYVLLAEGDQANLTGRFHAFIWGILRTNYGHFKNAAIRGFRFPFA
jgi:hypothetical protein